MIIFLAFCLILSTLVMQGLTLPWLIKRLGLAQLGKANYEEEEARRVLLREAMVHLDRSRAKDRAASQIFDDLTAAYQHRLDAVPVHHQERGEGVADYARQREETLAALRVERVALIRLRNEGQIDDEVVRTLERELDLAESRIYTSAASTHL
jgi:NhaP-type Na+/H+ or K+/H+ antiporter